MYIGFFAYQMPPWLCVIVALVPPMLVALLFRRLRYRGGVDHQSESKHASAVAILSTAFVFTVTFSTTQIWGQDAKIFEAANEVAQVGLAMTYEVDYALPEQSDTMQEKFTQLMAAMPGDTSDESIAPTVESREALRDIDEWTRDLPLDASSQQVMAGLTSQLRTAYGTWLVALNAPGIPDVMWLLIFGIGLLLVGIVAYDPPGSTPRYENILIFIFAMVVGAMQIPLWIMNSEGFAYWLAQSVLGEFTSAPPSIDRLILGVVVLLVLSAAFYFALKWVTSRDNDEVQPEAESLQT